MQRIRVWFLAPAIAVALGGCANLNAERELDRTESLVDARTGNDYASTAALQASVGIDQRVESLLNQPLSPDVAVQIALLRNPHMRINYARLGIAEADVLEASRLSNPALSAGMLEPVSGPFAALISGGLMQSFSDLLLLPVRKRLAVGEYQRIELLVAGSIVDLTADVRAAWYNMVSAQQLNALRATIAATAQASAVLAAKYHDAGNINGLQLALEQAAASQTRLASTRARLDSARARAALNELLGLQHKDDHWTIAGGLEEPVVQEDAPDILVKLASSQRLDLLAARSEVSLREQTLQTTQRYHLLGRIEGGIEAERDDDRARLLGSSLTLEVPVFNQRQGAIASARARLEEQRGQLQALELAIDASIWLGIQRVQAARDVVEEYRTFLIPQRDAALTASQENANYMLIGTFELLLSKQQQSDAYQGYLEAVRDYWLARNDLMRAVGARLPSEEELLP